MARRGAQIAIVRSIAFALATIPCWLIAFLASHSIVNKVTFEPDVVFKQRLWYAELLRIPGNLFLRMRKAPVAVLSVKQWHQRECELAEATVVDGKLKLKRLEGEPLSEYLNSDRCSSKKLEAVFVAMDALLEFHERFNQTHGDAAVTNVMVRELLGDEMEATWFDFDVAHVGPFSSLNRADDLRALLTTSGSELENAIPMLRDPELEIALREIEKKLPIDIFHLAQRIRTRGILPKKTSLRFAVYTDDEDQDA